MRAALCLALLVTVATPALAQDRYGPEPSALRAVPAADIAGQRFLTWANKSAPTAAEPPAPRPAPVAALVPQAQRTASIAAPPPAPAYPPAENAPWRRLGASPQTYVAKPSMAPQPMPVPQAVSQAAPQPMPAPQGPAQPAPRTMANNTPAPRPAAVAGPSRPLPPAALQAAAPQTAPAQTTSAQTTSAPAAATPATVPLAGAAPGTPDYRTDTAARATPAPQGEQARYYSLHRDYGETPDPIAIPEQTQVFLAAVPLSSLDQPDNQDADTGRTAAQSKARLTADWGAADDPSANTSRRVQITRP